MFHVLKFLVGTKGEKEKEEKEKENRYFSEKAWVLAFPRSDFETFQISRSYNEWNISSEGYPDIFSILSNRALGKGEAKNWYPLWGSFVEQE